MSSNTLSSIAPLVQAGPLQYAWRENWAQTPDVPPSRENGRTHGAAVTHDGHVYVFHQSVPTVLHFDESGQLIESWGEEFPQAHGMTLVVEDGVEYFWLTDQKSGLVAKTTRSGEIVQTIERPNSAIYEEKRYSPTWVAVNPQSGTIFVADGYGASLIHAYTASGEFLFTLDGEEGAGRFRCPHGVFVDTRGPEPELLVADRSNKRIQVYGVDGTFRRVFGTEELNSPCAFVTFGEYLFVPELNARLAIFDGQNQLVGYIGENEAAPKAEGWPNLPAEQIRPGKFNSPHGIAAGPDGSIYIVEWIIGGRITRLEPVK
jgi:DNA-binding beta-propeller fold protein YncE